MELDYDIKSGLEEWKDNTYKITDDFYNLKIYTNRIRNFLLEKTGKDIPIGSIIKLTKEEIELIKNLIWNEKKFYGLYGSYRVKAFDIDCFYIDGKDGLVTEDELKYDYTFNEL